MTTQLTSITRTENYRLVPPSGTFEIDPVHTFVTFRAQHLVVGRVRGTFTGVAGTINVDDEFLTSRVEVAIETKSINTLFPTRDDDLRSPDYLDVERFPHMTFRSSEITELPPDQWIVTGELTIRNMTLPVDLLFEFTGAMPDPFGNLRLGFHATTTISRREFGLLTLLEAHSGNLRVARDVEIEIDVEAIRPL